MTSPVERTSLTDLFGAALAQLAKLLQNEFDLARAELSEKVREIGGALKFILAGAVIVIPALVMVLFAIARGLASLGMPEGLADLIVGVAAAALAFILIGLGARRLSAGALKPTVTLDQISRDKVAAEEAFR